MAITINFNGVKIHKPGAYTSTPPMSAVVAQIAERVGEYSSMKVNNFMEDGRKLESMFKTMAKLAIIEEARIIISKDMIGPRLDYILEVWA